MLSLTKMLTGDAYAGDEYRYNDTAFLEKDGVARGRGPVVGWNFTRSCNLNCRHCYSRSENRHYENELTTQEGIRLIDDLAAFHVPALLFSGGEPLCREDFPVLAGYAAEKGIRVTLSTNGTLITPSMAQQIHDIGISYVGISFDGLRDTNDRFRGRKGAFEQALQGVRNCRSIGQRVGFRFTLSRSNVDDVPAVLDLMEQEDVNRICFYHLVYSGRGSTMIEEDLSLIEHAKIMIRAMKERKLSNPKLSLTRVDYPDNDEEDMKYYLALHQEGGEVKFERIPLRYWGNMKEQYEAHNPDYAGVYRPEK